MQWLKYTVDFSSRREQERPINHIADYMHLFKIHSLGSVFDHRQIYRKLLTRHGWNCRHLLP